MTVAAIALIMWCLVVLFFTLGLLSKPMVVTVPFVLLLLDYWPLKRFEFFLYDRPQLWVLVREKVPLFALAVASCIITYIVQQNAGAMSLGEKLQLSTRIANSSVSYISYLLKIIYPSRLAVLYPYYNLPLWRPIVSFLILAGVSVFVIYKARSKRYPVVGWLWYLGTLIPVIGLVQVGRQSMADRYTYLPSVGIFIIIVWGAAELSAKWRYRKVALSILSGAVIVILLFCTRVQVGYWQSGFTLYGRAVEVTINNYFMHNLSAIFTARSNLPSAA